MKQTKGLSITLLFIMFSLMMSAQSEPDSNERLVDNSLYFKVISERVHTRGMMEVCISDSTGNCIANLLSGYVVRVYNAQGEEIWAGKTAGREEMLRFPTPMPEAEYLTFTAFKPYVLNRITGARIYQDKPIQTKFTIGDG